MQLLSILALGGLAATATARNPARSVGKKFDLPKRSSLPERSVAHQKRQYPTKQLITSEASKST
jgi:carboxypeptidase D